MTILELLLIAIGLAMDSFAVAICMGLSLHDLSFKRVLRIALYFGFFQGFLPVLGYYLGHSFKGIVENIDHWVAFILLSFIGFNMIKESLDDKQDKSFDNDSFKNVVMFGIATSIDAFIVGITFAFFKTNVLFASLLIGFTTVIFSCIGLKLGKILGDKLSNKAELIGGIILVALGMKILLEHLGIINF